MTKNKFRFQLILITFICLISILYSLCNIKDLNKYKNEALSLKYSIEKKSDLDNYFSHISDTLFFSELIYSNRNIIDQHFYLGKDWTKKDQLSLLLKNNKVLIFKYSKNACYSCIQSIIEMLGDAFTDYKNNNYIIFVSDDIESRFKDDLHGKAVMTTSTPIIIFEEYFLKEAPCFFIIDGTMQIKHLHFYNKANENRTRIYLKFISSYLKS